MKNYGHDFDISEGGLKNPVVYNAFKEVIVFLNNHR